MWSLPRSWPSNPVPHLTLVLSCAPHVVFTKRSMWAGILLVLKLIVGSVNIICELPRELKGRLDKTRRGVLLQRGRSWRALLVSKREPWNVALRLCFHDLFKHKLRIHSQGAAACYYTRVCLCDLISLWIFFFHGLPGWKKTRAWKAKGLCAQPLAGLNLTLSFSEWPLQPCDRERHGWTEETYTLCNMTRQAEGSVTDKGLRNTAN